MLRNCVPYLLISCLASLPLLASNPGGWEREVRKVPIGEDRDVFELVGQVKNTPSPGPGVPATSVQYGYLSAIKDLDKIFTTDDPTHQNETTARFTFYNDSVTLRAISHGSLLVINREGISTIYFNNNPNGDLTTPNPDSFRSGTPILTFSWKHQVVFEPTPLSGHFFVHFESVVTSTDTFNMDGQDVRIGKVGDKFRINLVGDPDPAGKVNGKFAGYAVGLSARQN